MVIKLNNFKRYKYPEDINDMLTHISTCMYSLLDYRMTSVADTIDTRHNDEVVLYKAIARLVIITFSIFKNINSQNI